MQPQELEGWSRSELIERAEGLGAERASVLTRAELIDEIVRRTVADPVERRIARGLLGLARDLVARVVERGLHLPDAAARIRGQQPETTWGPVSRAPIATVTLAEIYAAQGHKGRALSVLDQVLETEPEHEAASSLRDRIASGPEAGPALPPEPEEPAARVAPLPDEEARSVERDEDEVVLVPIDRRTAHVRWAVREQTFDDARAEIADGRLILRVLAVTPSWGGPVVDSRDIEVSECAGAFVLCELPEGAILRAAVGWRSAQVFEPFSVADEPPPVSTDRSSEPPSFDELTSPWPALGASTVEVRASALAVS
jgi:hypothetical protein